MPPPSHASLRLHPAGEGVAKQETAWDAFIHSYTVGYGTKLKKQSMEKSGKVIQKGKIPRMHVASTRVDASTVVWHVKCASNFVTYTELRTYPPSNLCPPDYPGLGRSRVRCGMVPPLLTRIRRGINPGPKQ